MKINNDIDMSSYKKLELHRFTLHMYSLFFIPSMYSLFSRSSYEFLRNNFDMSMKYCVVGHLNLSRDLLALASIKEELLMHADLLGIEIKDCTFEEAN